MAAYLLSNAKVYLKDILSNTAAIGATFRISTDLERNLQIETGGVNAYFVLKSGSQIERFLIAATGGVATIIKRGLEQDGITQNSVIQKSWNDGTIGYITAKPDDFIATSKLDSAGGLRTMMGTAQNIGATNGSPNITVVDTNGWFAGATITGTGIPNGTTILSFVPNTSAILSVNFTGTTGIMSATVGKRMNIEVDVNNNEVKKPIGVGSSILNTETFRKLKADGTYEDILYSIIKNDLSSAGSYIQTVTMGEALAAAGYGSNQTELYAVAGSFAGSSELGERVMFPQNVNLTRIYAVKNASNTSANMLIRDDSNNLLYTLPVANGTNYADCNIILSANVVYRITHNNLSNFGGVYAELASFPYSYLISAVNAGSIVDPIATPRTWIGGLTYKIEAPSNYGIVVLNNITYVKSTPSTSSAGSIVNRGIVFDNSYAGRKLGVVKTFNVTNSASGIIKLQDSSGTDIATRTLANGASSVDFGGAVIGTSYRLVVNDTVNWSSTAYYDAVATYQASMPFIASGISTGTADTTNAFMFSEINIDYGGKGYKAKKSSIAADFDFYLKFAGFTSGPKNVGDSVSLTCTKGSVVAGFSGLSDQGKYFVSNIPGLITLNPTTDAFYIGKAVGTQSIELDVDFLKYTDATFNVMGYMNCGAYPYPPAQTQIFKALKKGTIRLTTQTGVNGGNVTGTALNSVLKNGVSVYSTPNGRGNFDFACDAGDVFVVVGYSFQEAGSGSFGGGTITINLNDLMRTSKYVTL